MHRAAIHYKHLLTDSLDPILKPGYGRLAIVILMQTAINIAGFPCNNIHKRNM